MIISAAPFRISFAGGGSDIEVFYQRRRGAVLSTTINKYVYISVHPYFNMSQTMLKYSENELVNQIAEIKHPLFREVLKELVPQGGVEIVSTADVPSSSGLGSSSTFSVALYHALYAYIGTFCSKEKLARKACNLEIVRLHEPIGKQDQYAAAFGGLNFIEFNTDGTVVVTPMILPREVITNLEDNLLLFYLGAQRETRQVLADQNAQVASSEEKFNNLGKMVDLAYEMREQLLHGELRGFAQTLHRGWELKRTLSTKVSSLKIDQYYERALEYGALGGKLLGAGGSGFLLLYCEPQTQDRVRKALFDCFELPFKFDWAGSRIIYVGDHQTKAGFVVSDNSTPNGKE